MRTPQTLMVRFVRTVLVTWPTLRPLASYIRILIRAVFLADFTKTRSCVPCFVLTTRAERMDVRLLAFVADDGVAERAPVLAAGTAPPCVMIVVDVVVVAAGCCGPAPGRTSMLLTTVMFGSGAGELVPGAS